MFGVINMAAIGWDPTNLRSLITQTDMTREAVSKATGISNDSINAYLYGTPPSLEKLTILADYFAVPLDFLTGRCSKEETENIIKDYSKHFMELRRAPYESYLYGRKPLDRDTMAPGECEAPYPYNLYEAIFGGIVDFEIRDGIIDEVLGTLTEREEEFIRLYFKEGLSRKEIAQKFDCSSSNVSLILNKALRKLRHPCRSKKLRAGYHSLEEIDEYAEKKLYDLNQREEKLNEREVRFREKLQKREEQIKERERIFREEILPFSQDERENKIREYESILSQTIEQVDSIAKIHKDLYDRLKDYHTAMAAVADAFSTIKQARESMNNSMSMIGILTISEMQLVESANSKLESMDQSDHQFENSIAKAQDAISKVNKNLYDQLTVYQTCITGIIDTFETIAKEKDFMDTFMEQIKSLIRNELLLIKATNSKLEPLNHSVEVFKTLNQETFDTLYYGDITVEELDLSVRSFNCLKRARINTVEDLMNKDVEEMLKVRNLGRKSFDEVAEKIHSMGLKFKNEEQDFDEQVRRIWEAQHPQL